ncbi:lathosterol oxidase-like [Patiria miniata]|uniref:Fatty acid hydroxylase domain-containing protein n=1 Tax=Patiria miniata TaxID=46514 RepID=A0A913Z9N8_PATMI|nr:lathosterol oxidase-like [Patiria miniata]
MDIVLGVADRYVFTKYQVYPDAWTEDYWLRQFLSLYVIVNVLFVISYFFAASLCYIFVFDKRLKRHPFFLKNQIRHEIKMSLLSCIQQAVLFAAIMLLEVRGFSKLYMYEDSDTIGYTTWFLVARDVIGMVAFSDSAIYWIHRWLHHRLVYKHIHKQHHMYKITSPFASHAFHPLDGFAQSLPYHVFPFLFPIHKYVYLVLLFLVNMWTISVHDGDTRVPGPLKAYINGTAHHTDHHLYYNYNYGQYFTLWDRIGNSYRTPMVFQGKSPLDDLVDENCKEVDGKEEATVSKGKLHGSLGSRPVNRTKMTQANQITI